MCSRAVITGIGVIASNGVGRKSFWNSLISGQSGIKKISRFDTSRYPSKIAGEVTDFNASNHIDKKQSRLLSRFAQFALASAGMAFEDAGLEIDNLDPYRRGISLGNTMGGIDVEEKQRFFHHVRNAGSINPFSAALINSNLAVGVLACQYGIKGPNMNFSTGCTSALNAISYAFDLIKDNRADVVIAGGSETPLVPFVFNAFCSSGGLSKWNGSPEKASRPFEKNRDGYILSEGCGIVIVESREHALKRKANIYAEIAGYGVSNDAYSLVKMEPTGCEAAKAIEKALEQSNVSYQDIDYINAHASSSRVTDKRETNAIKQVFKERAYEVSISSIKSTIGQTLGATGGLQIAATSMAVKNDCIPPTINYEEQDPDCDLDYTPNKPKSTRVGAALINCFGLGGNNISVVLKKFVEEKAVTA
jgi:3-oxoacyl-[acyl-carrier-protein] synthase II